LSIPRNSICPNSNLEIKMSSTRTKIAIIGTGLIGPRHAQAVLQEPSAQLLCIVDPNPAAKQVAKDLQTTYYASIKEMIEAGSKPDAAIVCTPNHTHVPVSMELLDAGIHVLVEKPISGSGEEGEILVYTSSMFPINIKINTNKFSNRSNMRRPKICTS
jgi:predicted dehydrogenase